MTDPAAGPPTGRPARRPGGAPAEASGFPQQVLAVHSGWARPGADIRDALSDDIDALTAVGDLIESEGGLNPAEGS